MNVSLENKQKMKFNRESELKIIDEVLKNGFCKISLMMQNQEVKYFIVTKNDLYLDNLYIEDGKSTQ